MHPISNILITLKNQCGQNSFVWSHFNWSQISTSSKLNMKFNSSITKYIQKGRVFFFFLNFLPVKLKMMNRYRGHGKDYGTE